MTNGFFLDEIHRVHNVRVVGQSPKTGQAWFDINRGSYIETIVTNKCNIFMNEATAKKEAFIRLLKNKEVK